MGRSWDRVGDGDTCDGLRRMRLRVWGMRWGPVLRGTLAVVLCILRPEQLGSDAMLRSMQGCMLRSMQGRMLLCRSCLLLLECVSYASLRDRRLGNVFVLW